MTKKICSIDRARAAEKFVFIFVSFDEVLRSDENVLDADGRQSIEFGRTETSLCNDPTRLPTITPGLQRTTVTVHC